LQRLKIAFRAITLGADIERVCRNLSWKEFEDVTVTAFQTNGYSTIKHFRFRHENRMWEIDVLAVKGKIVVCVDCKRWMKRLSASTMSKVAEAQIERVRALSKSFSKIMDKSTFPAEGRIFLIPIILSLVPASSKFCNGVPIVPILQLQNFLDELPAHMHLLNFIEVTL
ncbi:restriction endonuclease, partial [Candidatus Bathyarchaeota archaeon]|nr:restriction endonuclease [Candidatus Bathyarchaeota archaeon]